MRLPRASGTLRGARQTSASRTSRGLMRTISSRWQRSRGCPKGRPNTPTSSLMFMRLLCRASPKPISPEHAICSQIRAGKTTDAVLPTGVSVGVDCVGNRTASVAGASPRMEVGCLRHYADNYRILRPHGGRIGSAMAGASKPEDMPYLDGMAQDVRRPRVWHCRILHRDRRRASLRVNKGVPFGAALGGAAALEHLSGELFELPGRPSGRGAGMARICFAEVAGPSGSCGSHRDPDSSLGWMAPTAVFYARVDQSVALAISADAAWRLYVADWRGEHCAIRGSGGHSAACGFQYQLPPHGCPHSKTARSLVRSLDT